MSLRHLSALWGKLFTALALVTVLSGPVVGAAAHADGVDTAASFGTSRMLGAQRPLTGVADAPTNNPCTGNCKLSYHNGPVEHTNKVYAIYWVPAGYTVDANYESLINRYFTDVAAASGTTGNVYDSDTQYYDKTNGKILYSSTFAGSIVDTDALPASGCSDSPMKVCVTDAQLQTEVSNVVAAQGLTPNSSTEFFMFTAKGIGSCFDSSNSECAFSTYCAYHSWIGSGSNVTLYANMPYADSVTTGNCDVGQHPNGDDADATINVTSHEHNETITDEQGTAWWNSSTGSEDGDECAWYFGTVHGSNGAEYNQIINGNHYFLQLEWSNATNKCVQKGT